MLIKYMRITYSTFYFHSIRYSSWCELAVMYVTYAGGEGMAGARRRAGVQPQGAGQDVHV